MNSTLPSVIETSRLTLRSYREGDEHWYFEMSKRNRAHLEKYEPDNPALEIKTEEDAQKTIAYFVNAWKKHTQFFMGVFLKESEQFVAQIYIGSVNQNVPEFGIGYFSDVKQEGKGYVTEAVNAVVKSLFEILDAHRIQIETDDTNIRSIRVAERCGFVQEGHIRENKKNSDGIYSGTIFFGLLRNEFLKKKDF
ncbi:MAG: GNAT family N-acetyltransferase [Candidatus Thorarchaeota archaeon]